MIRAAFETSVCTEERADWKYLKLVRQELIHDSSLLSRDEEEDEFFYDMHRLIRKFIVTDRTVPWGPGPKTGSEEVA